MMTQYPTFDDFEEEHFRTHPEDIEPFINDVFDADSGRHGLSVGGETPSCAATLRGVGDGIRRFGVPILK